MQIPKRIKISEHGKPESEYDRNLEAELLSYTLKLSEILNGGLKFSDNMYAEISTTSDTGNANTEFAVAHTMKTTPTGFIVINIDKAGIVYDSGTAWTATNIYLKCSAANAEVKIILLA